MRLEPYFTPIVAEYTDAMTDQRQYDSLEASELFCGTCKRSQPVRQHLLLVLPTGNKYEYRCGVCGTQVGAKDDSDAS